MLSKFVEHPLCVSADSDLIKVRLQTQPLHPQPHYTGALDCFKKLTVTEGVRGLFRGVSMPLLGATLENASLFLTYNQTQHILRVASDRPPDSTDPLPFSLLAVAAAVSGAVTGIVLTPFELIKCKMQVQTMARGEVHSPISLITRTIREGGFSGMWLGLSGTLIRETGGGVAWFLTFEAATKELVSLHKRQNPSFERRDLGAFELMASGAAAGIAYNTSLFPVRLSC